jgi:hypothetical protein
MVLSQTYLGFPGSYYIESPSLFMVTPLRVCREGRGYNLISSMPAAGSRDCYYDSSTGRLHFGNMFLSPVIDRRVVLEKVFVHYKV